MGISPPAIFLIEMDSAKSVDEEVVIRDDERYASTSHPKESAQQENDQCLLMPRHMTCLDNVCEHETKLDLGRQNHEHDENSCSMNAPNTGYYEAGVDDLNITAHKGLRQRFIMAIETIQQDSDTDVATRHRKIQDETRDSE